MKEIGIVTLLSVIAIAAAPHARSEKLTVFVSQKSAREFGECFADAHAGPYSDLIINDRGSRREILLRNAAMEGPEARAVKQCL
jgi:hypothetical protein